MRFKSIIGILAVLLAVIFIANVSFAQKDESKSEETITCPVTGETVLKSEAVGPYAYNGTDYYFCCNGCVEKFKKDPETYLNKTTDITCGMSVDKRKAQKVTFEGKDYYFCSDNCAESFKKDPRASVMKAMKAAEKHDHGEKCTGDCDKTAKAEDAKACCSDKVKVEKKSMKKKM